jgi:hypothetical protein
MDLEKVQAIENRAAVEKFKEVQAVLGFTDVYQLC